MHAPWCQGSPSLTHATCCSLQPSSVTACRHQKGMQQSAGARPAELGARDAAPARRLQPHHQLHQRLVLPRPGNVEGRCAGSRAAVQVQVLAGRRHAVDVRPSGRRCVGQLARHAAPHVAPRLAQAGKGVVSSANMPRAGSCSATSTVATWVRGCCNERKLASQGALRLQHRQLPRTCIFPGCKHETVESARLCLRAGSARWTGFSTGAKLAALTAGARAHQQDARRKHPKPRAQRQRAGQCGTGCSSSTQRGLAAGAAHQRSGARIAASLLAHDIHEVVSHGERQPSGGQQHGSRDCSCAAARECAPSAHSQPRACAAQSRGAQARMIIWLRMDLVQQESVSCSSIQGEGRALTAARGRARRSQHSCALAHSTSTSNCPHQAHHRSPARTEPFHAHGRSLASPCLSGSAACGGQDSAEAPEVTEASRGASAGRGSQQQRQNTSSTPPPAQPQRTRSRVLASVQPAAVRLPAPRPVPGEMIPSATAPQRCPSALQQRQRILIHLPTASPHAWGSAATQTNGPCNNPWASQGSLWQFGTPARCRSAHSRFCAPCSPAAFAPAARCLSPGSRVRRACTAPCAPRAASAAPLLCVHYRGCCPQALARPRRPAGTPPARPGHHASLTAPEVGLPHWVPAVAEGTPDPRSSSTAVPSALRCRQRSSCAAPCRQHLVI